ncbi:hypothetical protein [Ancylobacter defluvii]|uniref:Uncharacterized protein n=1 Tax=Ancylobacter defluvii TaxID=1282440 RepID=A0A9W6K2F9_9HYPH|nr:hypothetical protein [Ancylobacter defluvii]MBS7586437.1 hypothetical protein [Ancylobacter defluvii]GLK85718.1 hypothetical protein GCM10017653_37880 [Ancylobacter defluvii]
MSETVATITLDQVLDTARAVVNHKSTRPAIGVPVTHTVAMAHTVCGLDDIAKLAADLLAASAKHAAAGAAGDIDAEVAALEQLSDIEAELTGSLQALGYLTLTTKQEADHGR